MDTADLLAAITPPGGAQAMLSAVLLLVMGLLLGLVARSGAHRLMGRVSTPERATLARRIVFLLCLGLGGASSLNALGVDLTLFLGAAGVFSVAIGFASQTSASNIISGLFLIIERPFSVGDLVEVGGQSGEVRAVDFLSTSIRTFDNLYVRLPNEMVMKSQITNLTRFAIRRFEVFVRVPLGTDHGQVRDILSTALREVLTVLDEPAPAIRFVEFGEVGAVFRVLAWAERSAMHDARDEAAQACHAALLAAGIEIPARILR